MYQHMLTNLPIFPMPQIVENFVIYFLLFCKKNVYLHFKNFLKKYFFRKKIGKKMETNTPPPGFELTSTQISSKLHSTHHWPHSLKHLRIFELYHSNYFVCGMIYVGAKWDEIISEGAFLVWCTCILIRYFFQIHAIIV